MLKRHLVEGGRTEEFSKFHFAGSKHAVRYVARDKGGKLLDYEDRVLPASAFKHGLDGFCEGGCYCQDEDRREAFVDAMLAKALRTPEEARV